MENVVLKVVEEKVILETEKCNGLAAKQNAIEERGAQRKDGRSDNSAQLELVYASEDSKLTQAK